MLIRINQDYQIASDSLCYKVMKWRGCVVGGEVGKVVIKSDPK